MDEQPNWRAMGACCEVCMDQYDVSAADGPLTPRSLPCGHTFCTGCLIQVERCSTGINVISCPRCKYQVRLQDNGFAVADHSNLGTHIVLRALPKNFDLIQMLEQQQQQLQRQRQQQHQDGDGRRVSLTPVSSLDMCSVHNEEKKILCFTCVQPICIYCQVHGEHRAHRCELSSKAMELLSQRLQQVQQSLEDKCTSRGERLQQLCDRAYTHHEAVHAFEQNATALIQDMLQSVAQIGRKLTDRTAALKHCEEIAIDGYNREEIDIRCEADTKKATCQSVRDEIAALQENPSASAAEKLLVCVRAQRIWDSEVTHANDLEPDEDSQAAQRRLQTESTQAIEQEMKTVLDYFSGVAGHQAMFADSATNPLPIPPSTLSARVAKLHEDVQSMALLLLRPQLGPVAPVKRSSVEFEVGFASQASGANALGVPAPKRTCQ